ncbi:hypothetical protein PGT21_018869 [Puccinia graminis f. sp. tritici]|uniref:Uncharacterized protein n=1 Tax=Puccinia graminis f. sp. tritici TaxID=56615 RepID=A0A5B0MIN0_PUCGR|nr:hypothetical protein PGT21_018869 [Puccinia graminis f. sp. tritici]KAA1126951.1 hypothetical protein PGTUg99_033440 [Puccinia graminis f. sp. tritici]
MIKKVSGLVLDALLPFPAHYLFPHFLASSPFLANKSSKLPLPPSCRRLKSLNSAYFPETPTKQVLPPNALVTSYNFDSQGDEQEELLAFPNASQNNKNLPQTTLMPSQPRTPNIQSLSDIWRLGLVRSNCKEKAITNSPPKKTWVKLLSNRFKKMNTQSESLSTSSLT